MDIPLNCIILNIMLVLKENNRELILPKKILIVYLKRLLSILNFDKDTLEDMIFDFNLNDEIYFFMYKYDEYFEIDDDNNIILTSQIKLEDIKLLLLEEAKDSSFDKDFLIDIYQTISSHYCFLEILGININKDIYNVILEIENEIEKEYLHLGYGDLMSSLDVSIEKKRIKALKAIINCMYINMENNLSMTEYKNIATYANETVATIGSEDNEIYTICQPVFAEGKLINNPMDRAIFLKDTNSDFVIKNRLIVNIKRKDKKFTIRDLELINFYLTYLELLDNEIKKINDYELKDELIISKYELMYTIDEIYDLMNFNRKEEILNINSDYDFIIPIVYFYAFELLNYKDEDYILSDKKKNIMVYYFNIMKKLYIEAYYKLTKNKMIIDKIKKSNLYGTNKVSTSLLDSFIPNVCEEKKKSRRYFL